MQTFQERFCQAHHCPPGEFARKVFPRCLHRRALLIAPLLGGMRSDFFSTDRELLTNVARAVSMAEVHEEIRDYRMSATNTSWLHRAAKVRISARRVIRLAESLSLGLEPAGSGGNCQPE